MNSQKASVLRREDVAIDVEGLARFAPKFNKLVQSVRIQYGYSERQRWSGRAGREQKEDLSL